MRIGHGHSRRADPTSQLVERDRLGDRGICDAEHVGAERRRSVSTCDSVELQIEAPARRALDQANRCAAGRSGSRDTRRASPSAAASLRRVATSRHGAVRRRGAGRSSSPPPAGRTRQSSPIARALPAIGGIGAQPVSVGTQRRRVERHAGHRFEHRVGPAVLEHAVVARQQQRRVVVGGDEDEDRLAERRDRFEPRRRRRRDARRAAGRAARWPPTDPLTAISARERARCRGTRRSPASSASARVGRRRAGPGRQLHQRRAARRRSRHAAPSDSSGATARRRAHFLPSFCFAALDLLVDVAAIDRVAVAGERAGPRGDRLVVASELEEHVAVVILDDRVGLELIGGALQVVVGEIELVGLEVRPAEAVEIRAVVGLDLPAPSSDRSTDSSSRSPRSASM